MDINKKYDIVDRDEEDDNVQEIEETVEEMVIFDFENVEAIEVKKYDEHLYPPPEDPKVPKRMGRKKDPSSKAALKIFKDFRRKNRLHGYQL